MSWEPWWKGNMMHVNPFDKSLMSIGPIPVGVVVTHLILSELTTAVISGRLAITRSEAPARTLGDMRGEEPIFGVRDTTISTGPRAHAVRFGTTAKVIGEWAWGFEVLSGPVWINVAFQVTSTTGFSLIVNAVGFRRVADDRCLFEKT